MSISRVWQSSLCVLSALFVFASMAVAADLEKGFRVSGPYRHLNLQVILIHSAEQVPNAGYLTLKQALDQKLVVVHETGNVQQLAIENKGRRPVFIQSGDIVKGGRQDRVLRSDMIVPPRSGKVPLASFCVESGRWSGRGSEDSGKFAANTNMVSSRALKLSAKHAQNQGAVWASVAKQQKKLNDNLRLMRGKQDLDVRNKGSATSLQLTLENYELKQMAKEYSDALGKLLNGKSDVIGFAFAINGEVNSADLYGSRTLFRDLWPRLLDAAVVEAISEFTQPPERSLTAEAVENAKLGGAVGALMAVPLQAEARVRDLSKRTRLVIREKEKTLLFETRDRALDDAWVHRNYIVKGPEPVQPQPAPVQQFNRNNLNKRNNLDNQIQRPQQQKSNRSPIH